MSSKACKIVEGQRRTKGLNNKQLTSLLKFSCQRPKEQEKEILQTMHHNGYNEDSYAKEFGITIDDKPTSIDARVLPAPWLKCSNNGKQKDVLPQLGQWNMEDKYEPHLLWTSHCLDAEEIVHEEVRKDDEVMADAEEFKVDDVTDEVAEDEAEEQGNWALDGKNVLSDSSFLQRCQNSALNPYMETNAEEVEDDQIEQVDDDDEEEEEEEEEAGGERMDDGLGMQANDNSMDRDGLTGNFLQGVETSHIPYNNHGMSSMDLFGSRDGSFMDHGGPSFFNNGGKRLMEAEDDMHHLDRNNKRLRTNDMLDQNQNDFGYCMEQMHQWMEKAKMLHESKEQNYANSQYNQQMAINQLQERQNMLEMIIKSKDQELETKRAEVFRLERELFLMSDLVSGFRGALKSLRAKFADYRKRYHVQEKPLYQDAGPGGLVLSTREIEARKLKQEQGMTNIRMMANTLEQEFVNQFQMHDENITVLAGKVSSVGNEFEKLKEMAAQLKEARKHQKPSDKIDVSAEIEEDQKSLDGNE